MQLSQKKCERHQDIFENTSCIKKVGEAKEWLRGWEKNMWWSGERCWMRRNWSVYQRGRTPVYNVLQLPNAWNAAPGKDSYDKSSFLIFCFKSLFGWLQCFKVNLLFNIQPEAGQPQVYSHYFLWEYKRVVLKWGLWWLDSCSFTFEKLVSNVIHIDALCQAWGG